MGDLSKDFSRHEFTCKCGCGFDGVEDYLVEKLQCMRDYIRMKYRINLVFTIMSGCRCSKHNRNEGGTEMSDHLTGEGVDIKCKTSNHRYMIIDAALQCHVYRVGPHKSFVHIGVGRHNPQQVLWTY